jgi:dihydroflavonol-4-reductase
MPREGGNMAKTVLVTGASGFIAQQLILDLLEDGYSVRGTVRAPGKGDQLKNALAQHSDKAGSIELLGADLESDEGWSAAVRDVDCVMHVASPFPLAPPKDPQDLIRPAREGTLRVLRAARDAGVPRVVLTSSSAAIAYGYPQLPAVLSEEDWSDPDYADDCPPYPASKTIAERAAWDFVRGNAADMELVTINPVAVFGPILSADVRTSVGVIAQLLGGKIPMAPNAGLQLVDVRDVSRAHIAAMELPEAAGQRYALAGEFYTLLDTAVVLREAFPEYAAKLPRRKLPSVLVRLLSHFNSDFKTICYELDKRRFVSGAKAEAQLLGRPYISGRDAILASAETLIRYNAI